MRGRNGRPVVGGSMAMSEPQEITLAGGCFWCLEPV